MISKWLSTIIQYNNRNVYVFTMWLIMTLKSCYNTLCIRSLSCASARTTLKVYTPTHTYTHQCIAAAKSSGGISLQMKMKLFHFFPFFYYFLEIIYCLSIFVNDYAIIKKNKMWTIKTGNNEKLPNKTFEKKP